MLRTLASCMKGRQKVSTPQMRTGNAVSIRVSRRRSMDTLPKSRLVSTEGTHFSGSRKVTPVTPLSLQSYPFGKKGGAQVNGNQSKSRMEQAPGPPGSPQVPQGPPDGDAFGAPLLATAKVES